MARRRDIETLDLLSWEPPAIAERFAAERVRWSGDRARMARAIAEAIRESGMSRDTIHEAMQAHMGERFGRHTLDRVTSTADEGHEFVTSKLIAFLKAVPDLRVANELLAGTGFVAIPERYLGAIEDAICAEQKERIDQRQRLARKKWRGR